MEIVDVDSISELRSEIKRSGMLEPLELDEIVKFADELCKISDLISTPQTSYLVYAVIRALSDPTLLEGSEEIFEMIVEKRKINCWY